ncbi:VOC family protein [Actinokineospora enzanensis]|uniref:VOC family protein n=1 Tax=Actinokineospora enzanensis TaxID=155975 RepID=UPI0003678475|nr:VOC family protein [Actinokineospora enzanensis]
MGNTGARAPVVGWFDLVATDPVRGKDFYEHLLHWAFGPVDGTDDYQLVTAPDAGWGMGVLRAGDRDALAFSVVCADLDAAIPRLESAGAAVVEPARRTPAGDRHAVLTDVRGNRVGLLEPAADHPDLTRWTTTAAQNALAWFEIGTTDVAATRTFYTESFGWTYERDEAAEGVTYYNILPAASDEPIGGLLDLSTMPGSTDYAIPGLRVPDVSTLLERCEAAGGKRVLDPFPDGNGLVIGQFTDPVGNRWSAFATAGTA